MRYITQHRVRVKDVGAGRREFCPAALVRADASVNSHRSRLGRGLSDKGLLSVEDWGKEANASRGRVSAGLLDRR